MLVQVPAGSVDRPPPIGPAAKTTTFGCEGLRPQFPGALPGNARNGNGSLEPIARVFRAAGSGLQGAPAL